MFRQFKRHASTVATVVFLGSLLFYTFTKDFGAQAILTGSMYPALREKSLVVTRKNKDSNYQVGQIITFVKEGEKKLVYITHRITAVQVDENYQEYFVTQGDANTNGDGWRVYPNQVLGRVILTIPFLGLLRTN